MSWFMYEFLKLLPVAILVGAMSLIVALMYFSVKPEKTDKK